eukprot:9466755-Pyramimonas_sp.AAC.1
MATPDFAFFDGASQLDNRCRHYATVEAGCARGGVPNLENGAEAQYEHAEDVANDGVDGGNGREAGVQQCQ